MKKDEGEVKKNSVRGKEKKNGSNSKGEMKNMIVFLRHACETEEQSNFSAVQIVLCTVSSHVGD